MPGDPANQPGGACTAGPVPEVLGTVTYLDGRRPPGLTPVTDHPHPEGQAPAADARLVELVGTFFEHRRLSLSDPVAAEAFLATVETVTFLIDGAAATGALTPQQHEMLLGHMQALRAVPGQFGPHVP